jgi:signal transduction histidine kinase
MTIPRVPLQVLLRRFIVWEATAVLRHDLRNHLAAVRNATFYVRRRVEALAQDLIERDARVSIFLGLEESELDAADRLIGDRLPQLPERPGGVVDLGAVIAAAAAHVELPGGVALSAPSTALQALGDPDELAIALICLIENAAEAFAPGGGAISIACDRDGDHVMVSVGDDGPGIAADVLAHAFDSGFTTRPGHLGLGLNIVQRIAGRARGTVELTAKARGVRATLKLRAPSEAT